MPAVQTTVRVGMTSPVVRVALCAVTSLTPTPETHVDGTTPEFLDHVLAQALIHLRQQTVPMWSQNEPEL